jgi:hypothetical protein
MHRRVAFHWIDMGGVGERRILGWSCMGMCGFLSGCFRVGGFAHSTTVHYTLLNDLWASMNEAGIVMQDFCMNCSEHSGSSLFLRSSRSQLFAASSRSSSWLTRLRLQPSLQWSQFAQECSGPTTRPWQNSAAQCRRTETVLASTLRLWQPWPAGLRKLDGTR